MDDRRPVLGRAAEFVFFGDHALCLYVIRRRKCVRALPFFRAIGSYLRIPGEL